MFLPLPSDRLIQAFGIMFFTLLVGFKRKLYIDRTYILFLIIGVIMAVLSWIPLQWSSSPDTYYVKRSINILFYSAGFYFVFHFINQFVTPLTIGKLIDFIILIVTFQAVVSFYMFLTPDSYEKMLSYVRTENIEGVIKRLHLLEVRMLGISNSFFLASTNYGIHYLILCLVPYCSTSYLHNKKILYYSLCAIIGVAGILSGRTVIVALVLVAGFLCVMESRRFVAFFLRSFKIVIAFIVLLVLSFIIIKQYIDLKRYERIVGWAFEVFISYMEKGEVETTSTDAMISMYRWPEDLKTWFLGHGLFFNSDGSYYMRSDVGYVRLVYYFGIFGTLFFTFTQGAFAYIAATYYSSRAFKVFMFFLFLWVLILNLKGLSDGDFYFTLFIVFGSLIRRTNRLKESNLPTMVEDSSTFSRKFYI